MHQPPSGLTDDARLRHELLALLNGRQAHMTLTDAVDNFPPAHINSFPPNVPYTFWHLVEHLRIAQHDILHFITNPDYQAPPWPEGYWPPAESRASESDWQKSLVDFAADQEQLAALIQDPGVDLYAELAHAPGYTILREINVVADHNAYHVGELAIFRQVMGLWPAENSGVL